MQQGMSLFKNVSHWKTTTLGCFIILAAVATTFYRLEWKDAVYGIAVGVMLIFSPDTILEKINTLIKVLLIFCLTSCISDKKLASICSSKYPVRDSISIVEHSDTLYSYIAGEVIKIPYVINDTTYIVEGKCPPVKSSTLIKYRDVRIYQENTAKLHLKDLEINKISKSNAIMEDKINQLRKQKTNLLILLAIILGLYAVWIIAKFK